MAIDDFLTKYYARYAAPAPNIASSRNNTTPVETPYGSDNGRGVNFQAELGTAQNNAAQLYNTNRAKSTAPVATAMANQSAGQIPVDEYGIVQKAPPKYSAAAQSNLGTIDTIGKTALQGAQGKAAWQQMKKLQDLSSNYNVSAQFGVNYDPSLIAPGASQNNKGAQALAIAMTAYKNGTKYVWAGNSLTGGVDCSGLVQQAYARIGIKVPRSTYEQAKSGQVVKNGAYLPGDLIFYNTGSRDPNGIGKYGHVGIYMGNGQILEAANSRAGIRISNINGGNGAPSLAVRPWS